MGCSKDSSTLTAAIGITLDGRHAIVETVIVWLAGLILANANHHVCLAWSFIAEGSGRFVSTDCHLGIAYVTLPASTEYVAQCSASNIGISTGSEARRIAFTIIRADTKEIGHVTGCTRGIDVLVHRTTEQCHISRAIDATAHRECCISIATSIDIITDSSPRVDDHVRIVFKNLSGTIGTVIHLGCSGQWVREIGVLIYCITCE